jgi:hypothetical protein
VRGRVQVLDGIQKPPAALSVGGRRKSDLGSLFSQFLEETAWDFPNIGRKLVGLRARPQ